MMKLKLSLKNSVRTGLPLSLYILSCLILGCSSSTKPTYSKENIVNSIQDICKNEYRLDVKAKISGQTLWAYLPLEDIFEKSDKPEKYLERFDVEQDKSEFTESSLKVEYLIRPVPEKEKFQEYKYNKDVLEKINNAWKVLRRVLFSMQNPKEGGLQFFCLVTADIKNGFEIKEVIYNLDLKKVSYGFISWSEYQHRNVQDMGMSPEIIGDKEGLHLNYKDITWQEFITGQIQQRIRLKFQKPEVAKNADIDKEVLKAAIYTLKIYDFKDFSSLEMENLLTNNKALLNQAAVWARFTE